MLKSGKACISTGDIEAIKLTVEDNKIDLNIVDKDFLKLAKDEGSQRRSLHDMLSLLKDIAEELKDEGYTITVSYQGKTVLTLGSEATPMLSRLVTHTDAIEINNMAKLVQMAV